MLQYSTVKFSTVQYSTVQYVLCATINRLGETEYYIALAITPILYITIQYSTVLIQYSTVLIQYSTVLIQYSTVLIQYSTVLIQYSTVLIQYSTVLIQYSTVLIQYSTVIIQYSTTPWSKIGLKLENAEYKGSQGRQWRVRVEERARQVSDPSNKKITSRHKNS